MLMQAFEMDARRDGIQQGIQQGKSLGIAEGSRQAKLETAKNLLNFGLSIENIAQATGLTMQDVERLNL